MYKKKFIKVLKIFLSNPLVLIDIILMRYLTYNYNSPFIVRDLIYQLRIKLIPKLKNNDSNFKKEKLILLRKNGILLGIKNLKAKEVKRLNEDLIKLNKKSVFSSNGLLSKEVYSSKDLAETYSFLNIATDEELITLASQYFGCVPTIQFLTSWITYKNEEELNEMFFHMDHHGHKFLKLFFYLNDVNLSDGHHEYIKNTHNQTNFDLKIKNIDNSNNHLMTQILSKRKYGGNFAVNSSIIQKFLRKNIVQVAGQSGYSFIEDTRGLHRGTIIKEGSFRIVFQVLYTPNNNYKDLTPKGNSLIAFNKICEKSSFKKKTLKLICSQILNFK